MWILCLAEDSLETSILVFSDKQWNKYLWMSSAAVMIGALRVKLSLCHFTKMIGIGGFGTVHSGIGILDREGGHHL